MLRNVVVDELKLSEELASRLAEPSAPSSDMSMFMTPKDVPAPEVSKEASRG